MNTLMIYFPIAGQVLVGFYFVFFGLWNCYHWRPILKRLMERKIASPLFLISLAITWQTVAGGMILFNLFPYLGAILLLPYVLIQNFLFHPFWHFSGETKKLQLSIFITHLSLSIGALLLLFSRN